MKQEEITEVVTEKYALYNGDSCEVLKRFPDNSIHMIIDSPPFAKGAGGLYIYSSDERDISNNNDYVQFFDHYEFTVKEAYRILMPGRIKAVHCMDTPSGNSGGDYLIDFPGDLIRQHTQCRDERCTEPMLKRSQGLCGHGWFHYCAAHDIWKEPLGVRNRTMTKDLAHKTIVDDSTNAGVASCDKLLIFRKRGKNQIPVAHPTGLMSYAGETPVPRELWSYRGWTGDQKENRYSHWIWRRYASSNWDDVRIDEVLPYKEARDSEDEKHVHPLQLDVIQRAIILYSNEGENVLTEFLGVGSEAYGAVINNRRGIGIELKPTYFRQAVKNLEAAATHSESDQDSFDWDAEPEAIEEEIPI